MVGFWRRVSLFRELIVNRDMNFVVLACRSRSCSLRWFDGRSYRLRPQSGA